MENLTKQQKVRRLAESAIMVALATVLAAIPIYKAPYGGTVTLFSQVPIVIVSQRYGIKWGAFTGLVMAVIQLMFGLENFSYVTGILSYIILFFADYIIAFGALGLGGMFEKHVKNEIASVALGGAVVSVVRFFCHFISGVTIWGNYADGFKSVWIYSFLYNGAYMLPELIITVVGSVVIVSVFDLSSQNVKIRIKKQ